MSLTVREIGEVVGELGALAGAVVQKAHQPEPRTAVFELRQPGASHLLLVCAESGRTRLSVVEDRPPSPQPPYAFQGLLRADLVGAVFRAVEAAKGERLVRLQFETKAGARILVAELIGRHGNLFLLDEAGRIRGSAVPNLSKLRDNRAGRPYVPPLERASLPDSDRRSRFSDGDGPFPRSRQVDLLYREREQSERDEARRRDAVGGLTARVKKLERTRGRVQGDVARTERADEHRRHGELLKANLARIERGAAQVRVTEYAEDGVREVVVPLDPSRSPREDLERHFHQYRRLTAGRARALSRLAQLEVELASAREALDRAKAGDLAGLPERPTRAPMPRRHEAAAERLPCLEYVSASGRPIRVGRGARDNDRLTFRHAKPFDLWLHARGVSGAHVVVPLGKGEEPDAETLRDASLLAVHHSDARGEPKAEVASTRVKHVRRAKGGPPGAVTYSRETVVLVSSDEEALRRLLAGAGVDRTP